ncbi:MAG TPA: hypothetical protein DCS93_38435 [Microscillaceae bacterium]|nr:hypothetical protein [Microscillaceae bacterium]
MSHQVQSQGPENQQDQGRTHESNSQAKQKPQSSSYQTREGKLGPPPASWGGKPLEPIQAKQKKKPVQKKDSKKEKKPVQAKTGTSTSANSSSSSNGLPTQLKENMESMSGMDLSDVKVNYNSSKPKEMGALAYAQGNQIEIGPGQEKHLPHEAWHTVQQKQGRVQPNAQIQAKGLPLNNDAGLEKEADVMGEKAMSGNFTLSSHSSAYQSSALQMRSNLKTVQAKGVVQMTTISTNFGEFKDKSYSAVSDYGVRIELEFYPDKEKVDAKKIGLTQSLKSYMGGNAAAITPTQAERMDEDGVYLDRTARRNNPIYGGQQLDASKEDLNDTNNSGGNYKLGWNYKNSSDELQHKQAYLYDRPTRPGVGNDSGQIFETTALAIEGEQAGTYYGSVQWGWQKDGSGNFTKLALSKVSDGNPSASFIGAAERWNAAHSLGTIKTIKAPTNVYDNGYSVDFTVPNQTTISLTSTGVYTHNNEPYNAVRIEDGSGRTGKIKVADMQDQGDGDATVNLPIPE